MLLYGSASLASKLEFDSSNGESNTQSNTNGRGWLPKWQRRQHLRLVDILKVTFSVYFVILFKVFHLSIQFWLDNYEDHVEDFDLKNFSIVVLYGCSYVIEVCVRVVVWRWHEFDPLACRMLYNSIWLSTITTSLQVPLFSLVSKKS